VGYARERRSSEQDGEAGGKLRWPERATPVSALLTPLIPPKPGCHPQHDTIGAGTKICKCSSEINMKSASTQIIPM
jgi:hypothetical protein